MGSLTIPDLDETLRASLRERAATHGRSEVDEALAILQGALHVQNSTNPGESIADAFQRLVQEFGPIDVDPAPRERWRDLPDFDE
ncbi:hypothetical protein J4558_17885 [Leptolyngbya sp. 15MV]|nr:hypothetical protein J4558_17885 [Leptolyngbya sp. 15MV]